MRYIGVKMVEAVPMTRLEYNQYRGWDLPADENGSDDGFMVEYLNGGESNDSRHDGYISWSPKKIFEQANLCVADGDKIVQSIVDEFRGPVTAKQLDPKTTLVSAECLTGFVQHEVSSCVDPKNYDEAIGKKIGTSRIDDSLYKCLGFVLQWAKDGLKK